MSKYDFEIDTSSNSSTGLILSKIAKGSVVLEFGCAAGRMTRYMKEVLGCQVYVVEYDWEAYEAAVKYAVDGLCDDILNFRWVEKFKGIEFDAIIFADVLEHLVSPEKVLEQASEILKPTGSIHVSVPNITHNDILLKAYSERFDYTSIGILDDSHTHFWGLENLKMLSGKYGLYIRKIEGTYCPTGYTEQYEGKETDGNLLLTNMLKQRKCGEVYQFVVTMDKQEHGEIEQVFKPPFIRSHIYLDTGNDFNDAERIHFEATYIGQDVYRAHYMIKNTVQINKVRFDPIEFQGCMLRNLSITQGGKKLSVIYVNAIEMEDSVLLPEKDPMVIADALLQDNPIVIDAEVILLGEKFTELVLKNFQPKVTNLDSKIGNLNREIVCLNEENAELRRNVGAYITLANNKDKYAVELEQILQQKAREAEELVRILSLKEQEVNYYKNIEVVRLRAFILRVLRGIWRRVKRVLGKEERK